MRVGLGQVGIAVVHLERPDEATLVYHLRTARDEPGLLSVTRLDPSEDGDPVAVRLGCTIGRFGDPGRERQVMEHVAERLEELRGVEVSPIRR